MMMMIMMMMMSISISIPISVSRCNSSDIRFHIHTYVHVTCLVHNIQILYNALRSFCEMFRRRHYPHGISCFIEGFYVLYTKHGFFHDSDDDDDGDDDDDDDSYDFYGGDGDDEGEEEEGKEEEHWNHPGGHTSCFSMKAYTWTPAHKRERTGNAVFIPHFTASL